MGLLGRGLTAVATGGLSELPRLLKGGGQTSVAQTPLETPEQAAARKKLLQFGESGSFGKYTAGADLPGYTPGSNLSGMTPGSALPGFEDAGAGYSGSLGDFNMTGAESAGQNKLLSLVQSGLPEMYQTGSDEIKKLLTTDFYDPTNDHSGAFQTFKANLDADQAKAATALKRDAAFGGSLYGSDTVRRLGDLQAEGERTTATKLSDLYTNYVSQRLNAIPQALAYAQAGEGINQGRIAASQEYGGLGRILNDTNLTRQYSEYQRARGEQQSDALRRRSETSADALRKNSELSADALRKRAEQKEPLAAIQSVAGQNTQFGIPSVSVPTPNAWDKVLDLLAKGAGQAIGAAAAGG